MTITNYLRVSSPRKQSSFFFFDDSRLSESVYALERARRAIVDHDKQARLVVFRRPVLPEVAKHFETVPAVFGDPNVEGPPLGWERDDVWICSILGHLTGWAPIEQIRRLSDKEAHAVERWVLATRARRVGLSVAEFPKPEFLQAFQL